MLTFFITTEDRMIAQTRAAELDIGKTKPPGQYPYVWDNRMTAVNRWYDYALPDNKIGTIHFEPIRSPHGQTLHVRCTTEITQWRAPGGDLERRVKITTREEHENLVEYFFREIIGPSLQFVQGASNNYRMTISPMAP